MTSSETIAAVDGVHLLPVLHERIESADAVRERIRALRPDGIVVELPSPLESLWLRALERLPAISLMLYENAAGKTIGLNVHPADPLVEAGRYGRERGLPVRCGDLDLDDYADYRDPVPDSYAMHRLGTDAIHQAYRSLERPRDPQDDAREASMAHHAQALRSSGCERVLVLCGMHHVEGVRRSLAVEQAAPLARRRRKNARLVHLHPESLAELTADPPFYIAAYEARRTSLPTPPELPAGAEVGKRYGPFRILSGGREEEAGALRHAVERAALASVGPGPAIDRLKLQWAMIDEAQRSLTAQAPDERVESWQRRNLARFARKMAHRSGRLFTDLFDLLVVARGCVSANFAWELHRLGGAYPWQVETAEDLPTARVRADELFDGVRRLRLSQHHRRPKGRGLSAVLGRRRRGESYAGEWIEGFDENAICSYPPEDLLVEEFGRYMQKRGRSILSEEQARSEPFTTSVLDGIDVRETIRHWPERTIWVKSLGRVPGDVGPVVAIFDEDEEDERFPYRMTWLGEHDQESDMAFYSTSPEEAVVGPGICRVTYGGFMLNSPPRRMFDVWSDADYRAARSKAEVLLLAALDYSSERIVVHLAAKPPRSFFTQLAARLDRKILHVPLGTLSPATVRRIRVMHILAGHGKREIAADYIW